MQSIKIPDREELAAWIFEKISSDQNKLEHWIDDRLRRTWNPGTEMVAEFTSSLAGYPVRDRVLRAVECQFQNEGWTIELTRKGETGNDAYTIYVRCS